MDNADDELLRRQEKDMVTKEELATVVASRVLRGLKEAREEVRNKALTEGVLNGRSGRLYKRLVEQDKLAVSVGASNSPNKYVSEFSIQVNMRPDADVAKVEKIVWEELEKLKTEIASEREFQKVKNRAYAGLVRSLTDMENVATMLAYYEMFGDYRIFLNWANELDKVTAAEVQAAAQKTFVREKSVAGFLLKK